MRYGSAPIPEITSLDKEKSIMNQVPSSFERDINNSKPRLGNEYQNTLTTIDSYKRMKERQANLYSRLNALTRESLSKTEDKQKFVTDSDSNSQSSNSQTSHKTFPVKSTGVVSLSGLTFRSTPARMPVTTNGKESLMQFRLKLATAKAVGTAEGSTQESRKELAAKARSVADKYSSSLKISDRNGEKSYQGIDKESLGQNVKRSHGLGSGWSNSQREKDAKTRPISDEKSFPKTISIPGKEVKLSVKTNVEKRAEPVLSEMPHFLSHEGHGEKRCLHNSFSTSQGHSCQSVDTKSDTIKSKSTLSEDSVSNEDSSSSSDIPFENYLNEVSEGMRSFGKDWDKEESTVNTQSFDEISEGLRSFGKNWDKESTVKTQSFETLESTKNSNPSADMLCDGRHQRNQERRRRIKEMRELESSSSASASVSDKSNDETLNAKQGTTEDRSPSVTSDENALKEPKTSDETKDPVAKPEQITSNNSSTDKSNPEDNPLDLLFTPRYSRYLRNLEKNDVNTLKEITIKYQQKKKKESQENNPNATNLRSRSRTRSKSQVKSLAERHATQLPTGKKAHDRLFERAKTKQEEGKERRRQIEKAMEEKKADALPFSPRSQKMELSTPRTSTKNWYAVQ